jgi:hypothetical protein
MSAAQWVLSLTLHTLYYSSVQGANLPESGETKQINQPCVQADFRM